MENGHGRVQQMQQEVEDVRIIMLDNFKKAEQRDGGLNELDSRCIQLEEKGKIFRKKAGQVNQKMSKKNNKWRMIAGGVVIASVLLIIIITIIIVCANGSC